MINQIIAAINKVRLVSNRDTPRRGVFHFFLFIEGLGCEVAISLSGGDIPNAKSSALPGNNYVLSVGNGKVYIYNGSGTIATFPIKEFKSIGNK
ncbi:hypothetical protein [Sinomicrobium oceani]|uniref:hypothetical protein n=1 Tax=Sinomicrobium oceani TaxID=1150368 RepID=UPI000930CD58|nr:hypothetical protein [Sinomicrobium oceani]